MPRRDARADEHDLALGVPRIATHDYIALDAIAKVSLFRGTGWGHDHSDGTETCRTMKHYYFPRLPAAEWGTIAITAPVAGRIVRLDEERSGGTQVHLQATSHPAFTFVLFHVTPVGLRVGDAVSAGQPLGTHVGGQTTSDVAVTVTTPGGARRLVSFFETMTDALFATYQARGAQTREDFIRSAEARDADTAVTCDATGGYVGQSALPAWFVLN